MGESEWGRRKREKKERKRERAEREHQWRGTLLWKFRIIKTYRSSPMYSNIESSAGKASWFEFSPWFHIHASDLPIYGLHEWVRNKTKKQKNTSRLPGFVSGSILQTESKVSFVLSCRACPNDLPRKTLSLICFAVWTVQEIYGEC